jgi:hypothetical protein
MSRRHAVQPGQSPLRGQSQVKHQAKRRRRNVVGQHVWLRCVEMDAAGLVAQRLPEIVKLLEHHDDVWVRLSLDGVDLSFSWE